MPDRTVPQKQRSGIRWALPGAAHVLLVLNMLLWAGNWVVGRAIHTQLAPIELAFWRWLLAFALLTPFAAPRLWAQRAVLRREWRILLVLGGLGIALFNTLIYLALQYTTAINGVLIASCQPVAIVAFSWLLFRDTIDRRQGLGIAVSLAGVVAIVSRGDPAVLAALRFNAGDLISAATVPVWALYSVLLRKRPPELDPFTLLAALMGVGLVLMLPVYVLLSGRVADVLSHPANLGAIAYVALAASLAGYMLWNSAVARVGANVAGQFIHLVPAFTTGLAFVFLGESLRLYHLAGVTLVFVGIWLATAGRSRRIATRAA